MAWGPAIQRLGVELDQILGGIVRDAFLIEDRHIVVIPAADAAGAFQLALVHEEDAQPLLARAESRAAAGRTGADDEHVRFDERTERMSSRWLFMVPSCCEVRCGGGPRRGSAASHASFCEKNIIKNTCIVKSKKNTYHSKNSYSEAAMIEELNGDFPPMVTEAFTTSPKRGASAGPPR